MEFIVFMYYPDLKGTAAIIYYDNCGENVHCPYSDVNWLIFWELTSKGLYLSF